MTEVNWQMFANYFTDEQILSPNYAVAQFAEGAYCKLCESKIVGKVDPHLRAHARELKAWRKSRASTVAAKQEESLKRAREEKQRLKAAGIEKPPARKPATRKRSVRRKAA